MHTAPEFSAEFREWMGGLGPECLAEFKSFGGPAAHTSLRPADGPARGPDLATWSTNGLFIFRYLSLRGDGEGSWHLGGLFFVDRLADGWVRLSDAGRGVFLFDFASMEVAEAYLSVRHADLVREQLGNWPIRQRNDRESGRFASRVVPWQGPPLYSSNMRVFSAGGKDWFRSECHRDPSQPTFDRRAIELTWYADRPLSEVLESLRDPDGGPLFGVEGDDGD